MDEHNNALKAVSKTDDELRAANYMVLFGGRDLTAFGYLGSKYPMFKNDDGSAGEYFSKSVELESPYTEIGRLPVDWEHGKRELEEDDVLGYVDWKTAKVDERGVFVERVLNRRNKYMQWLEDLIDAGLIGNSTESIPGKGVKTETGEIVKWPLRRDTLTVIPMEPRMLTGNTLKAYKAMKSLITSDVAVQADEKEANQAVINTEDNTMNEEIKTAVEEAFKGVSKELAEATAEQTKKAIDEQVSAKIDEFKASQPEVKAGYHIEIVEDEADKALKENPFKSAGEFYMAVKNTAAYG